MFDTPDDLESPHPLYSDFDYEFVQAETSNWNGEVE